MRLHQQEPIGLIATPDTKPIRRMARVRYANVSKVGGIQSSAGKVQGPLSIWTSQNNSRRAQLKLLRRAPLDELHECGDVPLFGLLLDLPAQSLDAIQFPMGGRL